MIGSLQALEALKFLTGAQPPLIDAFLNVDLATLESTRVTVRRRPDCPDCGERMRDLSTIRRVAGKLRRDVAAVRERDPAAEGVSTLEILTGWPGLHALLTHRVAHALDAARTCRSSRARSPTSRAR